MTTIAYDRPVRDLIAGLSATGHVNHQSYTKTMVTIHHNAGVLSHDDVLNAWKTREASAHFDVDRNGAVAQYVDVHEYAWACGDTYGNQTSISIEMSNSTAGGDWPVSETTWREAARLAGWLFAYVIKARPDSKTLVPHHYWYSTACPGRYMDGVFGQLISLAQQAYDSFVSGGTGDSMDEASIASAILGASIARQGIGMDNKPKTGATSLRSILSYEDAGWELPVRELKPLIQELIDSVNELKTEVAALKQSSGTAGGTAHVKIEGDFPFTPSS
jgi:hypothetical protein